MGKFGVLHVMGNCVAKEEKLKALYVCRFVQHMSCVNGAASEVNNNCDQ